MYSFLVVWFCFVLWFSVYKILFSTPKPFRSPSFAKMWYFIPSHTVENAQTKDKKKNYNIHIPLTTVFFCMEVVKTSGKKNLHSSPSLLLKITKQLGNFPLAFFIDQYVVKLKINTIFVSSSRARKWGKRVHPTCMMV